MIKFFIDFDGTISTTDVVDLVLEKFADAEWKRVEKEWAEGRIGSRECLSRQIALVRATNEDLKKLFCEVGIDSHFEGFLREAAARSLPLAIVSDGFDVAIQEILKRNITPVLMDKLPIFCNRLEWAGGRPLAYFTGNGACTHGCANCKPAVMAQFRSPGDFLVFIGDGLSDRFAAEAADLTFAKGKLLDFCRERGLRHIEYRNFKDIQQWLIQSRQEAVTVQ